MRLFVGFVVRGFWGFGVESFGILWFNDSGA